MENLTTKDTKEHEVKKPLCGSLEQFPPCPFVPFVVNAVVVSPSRDYAGLRIAARELMEAELFSADDQKVARSAEHAANREQVLAALKPRLTLADGYYERALYLFDLEGHIEAGVKFAARDLDASEARGLRAIKLGRADFQRAHPDCPQCGAPQNDAFAQACKRCGLDFRRTRKEQLS